MLRFARSLAPARALCRAGAPSLLRARTRWQSSLPSAALEAATAAPAAAAALDAAAPAAAAISVSSTGLPNLALLGPSFLDAGFPAASPHLWAQYGLMKGVEGLHEVGGLEWWGAIAAASVGLRCATFVLFFVRSTRMGAWMQHYSETLTGFTDRLTAERAAGNKEGSAAVMKEYFAFMASKDLSLAKYIVAPAVAQLVIFASFFTGLRKLAVEAHLVPGLAVQQACEGTWLLALHLPDPTYALPIASAILSAAAIAANPNMAGVPQAELTPGGQKVIFGSMATLFNLAACTFPSSVQLYLTVTSATMLAQQGLLRMASVKAFFNFPPDWPLSAEVLAERAARRKALGKDTGSPLVDGMKDFAPVFRVASDLAEGRLRRRPKHQYIGFLGLREPGVPPPPTQPHPAR